MKSILYFVKWLVFFTLFVAAATWFALACFEGSVNIAQWSFEARDFFSSVLLCAISGISIFLGFKRILNL